MAKSVGWSKWFSSQRSLLRFLALGSSRPIRQILSHFLAQVDGPVSTKSLIVVPKNTQATIRSETESCPNRLYF
jgi:hypothetical protein